MQSNLSQLTAGIMPSEKAPVATHFVRLDVLTCCSGVLSASYEAGTIMENI